MTNRSGVLFDRIRERVQLDANDGDIAYFHALMLELEYLAKVMISGVVSIIADESDRHRYSIEHGLVRADSLGDWVSRMNTALTGPASQFFLPSATGITRDLTERVCAPDWRHEAVAQMAKACEYFGLASNMGSKVALRQYLELAASLRNRTRGHGATTATQASDVIPVLEKSIDLVISNAQLFQFDWGFLKRNFSGKYRLSPMWGACKDLGYLTKTSEVRLQDGVYIVLEKPVLVTLLSSDPELRDILVPNGAFRDKTFEIISMVTNDTGRRDGSAWMRPPGRLPESETEGASALEIIGNVFANLPPLPLGTIQRISLETRLIDELADLTRHPILTLTGPGGIGKTTLALSAIRKLANRDEPGIETVLWFSARDIDLIQSGPKPVSPKVSGVSDIVRFGVDLLEPKGFEEKGFDKAGFFERRLGQVADGPTLFVFDNFETMENPADVFSWIDTFIRPPNKALITTRFRDFVGDYPIEIRGMTEIESTELIDKESKRLGVHQLINSTYREELYRESDGHPYVMKILLGRVAAEGRAVTPERIVASADTLLAALFERTFESVTPAAQRVFMLLSSWRAFVPRIAVEAVALRKGNERFDVIKAIDELRRYSLVEEIESEVDGQLFLGVPLAASSFGRRKLQASPAKAVVEDDRKLLFEFGAGKREDAQRGVLPRIQRLVKVAAKRANESPGILEEYLPILEYLATHEARAFLDLANLSLEVYGGAEGRVIAQRYLQRFLEVAPIEERMDAWLWLADLYENSSEPDNEIHALSEAAILATASIEDVSNIANRINRKLHHLRTDNSHDTRTPEIFALIQKVTDVMERQFDRLSATECSRLAWLHLNISNPERARSVALCGIELEPGNEYCLGILRRMD